MIQTNEEEFVLSEEERKNLLRLGINAKASLDFVGRIMLGVGVSTKIASERAKLLSQRSGATIKTNSVGLPCRCVLPNTFYSNEPQGEKTMDPKTYQTEILQFESPVSEDQLDRLTAMAFPLHIAFTELIQLCEKLDKIKKHIYYGSEYDVKADFPDFDYAGPGYTSEDLKTRLRKNVRLVHAVLGITTEGAETSEAVINFLYGDSETLDVPNLQEENGDDSFYRAIMNDIFGFDFESTLQKNFEKLSKKRYKNGFSKDAAENRDLPGEREVFEK